MTTLSPIPGFNNNLLNAITVDTVGDYMAIQDRGPKNLYIFATSFGGGTVTVQWSIDTTHWATLNDPQGNPIAVTADFQCGFLAGLYGGFYRAKLAGSSGATDVCVRLV